MFKSNMSGDNTITITNFTIPSPGSLFKIRENFCSRIYGTNGVASLSFFEHGPSVRYGQTDWFLFEKYEDRLCFCYCITRNTRLTIHYSDLDEIFEEIKQWDNKL